MSSEKSKACHVGNAREPGQVDQDLPMIADYAATKLSVTANKDRDAGKCLQIAHCEYTLSKLGPKPAICCRMLTLVKVISNREGISGCELEAFWRSHRGTSPITSSSTGFGRNGLLKSDRASRLLSQNGSASGLYAETKYTTIRRTDKPAVTT
jgi:hypothetical protein